MVSKHAGAAHVRARNEILATAAAFLKSKGGSDFPLRHRTPQRAPRDSTFARFLNGDSYAYVTPSSLLCSPSMRSGADMNAADPEIRVVDFGAGNLTRAERPIHIKTKNVQLISLPIHTFLKTQLVPQCRITPLLQPF